MNQHRPAATHLMVAGGIRLGETLALGFDWRCPWRQH